MRWSSVISVILVFVVFALAGIANAAVNIQTPTNGTTINSLSVNFSFIPMGVNYSLFNCRIFVYGAGNTLYGNLSVAGVNNNTTASATWTATSNDNFIWNVTCINATGPEILTSGTYQFSINYTPPSSGSNGTISGYVLAADNSTIPNANVSISYPVYLSTTSDINGFYNFSSLNYTDPGTQYNISAQRPLNNSTYTPIYSILLNSTNYTIPQNLSFTQQDQQQANGTNGSISGYVFYQNGTAAANVTLSLSGPAVNWTLSNNSTGYYQFSNIFWPANYTVQAMGMGQLGNLSSPSLNNLNLNSGNYNLTGQNLTLQSSMDGQCQPGANWWVSGYAIDSATGLPIVNETLNINFQPLQQNQSGNGGASDPATGAFNVSCLVNGTYQIGAGGGGNPDSGLAPFMWTMFNITVNATNVTGFNLTLSRGIGGPQSCGGNASIYGHVRGINGTALSGVSLFAGSGGGQQSYGPESTGGTFCGGQASTDQNGSYNITGLSAGGYMLNVMPQLGSGYGQEQLGPDQQITLNSSSAVEKDFNLSLVGYVQGYVLGNSSNGTLVPLPGASISFYSPTPNGGWAGGITDDSGFFNISATPGSYDMQVNPPEEGGYSSYQSGHQNGGGVNVTSGSINNIGNITLRQGARITGYVLFNGTGVPNVGVNAFRQTNTPGMPSDMGFGFTNGSGYFFIAGLTGNATYQVQAYPDPSSPYSSGMTSVYLSETGASVNITLVQGNTVNGTVTCNGFPVQNAPVMLFKNSGTGNSGPEQMLGTMNPGSFAFAMADSSGNYLARGLTAGNYTMRVELPYGLSYNCSSYINGSVEIIGPTPLDVEMPLAATLSGHVNGTNGVNISGAFVSAFVPSLSGGPESGPSGYGQTDAGGNYVLRLSPGSTYMVTVQPPWGSSYASQAAPVQVNSSGAAYSKNFTLSSGGGIKGKVVDSNGNAVQFAFVNAFSQSAQSFGFVNTQPDGTFDVRGLSPANDFKVFIQPPSTTGGIVPTFIDDVAVTDGNETDLGTINATSATAFMLANISNAGIGIASADVHAWIPFTPYYSSCTTNSSGQCNLTGLAAGTYDVFIDAPGLPQVFSNATVSNGANSFNFDYASRGATYTVNGSLNMSNGSAVQGADVGIWSQNSRFGAHTQSAADGSFSFANVPNGTYQIGAKEDGFYPQISTLTVNGNTSWNTTLAAVNASSSYVVNGSVVSASGAAVASKTVILVDALNASSFTAFNITNGGGNYLISGVPPSTYVVRAVMGNMTYGVNVTVINASVTAPSISVP